MAIGAAIYRGRILAFSLGNPIGNCFGNLPLILARLVCRHGAQGRSFPRHFAKSSNEFFGYSARRRWSWFALEFLVVAEAGIP